jgi:hypothetical protein
LDFFFCCFFGGDFAFLDALCDRLAALPFFDGRPRDGVRGLPDGLNLLINKYVLCLDDRD